MMDASNLIDFDSPPGRAGEESSTRIALDKSTGASCHLDLPSNAPPHIFETGSLSLFSQVLPSSTDVKESLPIENIQTDNINVPHMSLTDKHFKVPSSCDNVERESISFKPLSTSFEIGRESMPFNISTLDPNDIGRPSLLVNQTIDFGRESLGILHLSARESIGLLNISPGKESLGILHHLPDVSSDLTADSNMPKILLTDFVEDSSNTVNSISSCMNRAFLLPQTTKESISSISSVSSFGSLKPAFNSHSYNSSELSKIYSVDCSSSKSHRNVDIMNDAFHNTQEFLRKFKFSGVSSISSICSVSDLDPVPAAIRDSPALSDFRARILSLPTSLDVKNEKQTPKKSEASFRGAIKKDIRKFWSAEKVEKTVPLHRRSFCGQLSFNEENGDDDFNDSVFIEANHIASKIANGLSGESADDGDLLDSTSPPELCDVDETDQNTAKSPPKCDKETVLKTVAKFFPVLPDPQSDLKFSLKLRNKPSTLKCNTSNMSNTSNKDHSTNISRTSENSDKDNSVNQSKRSNKSNDAKGLLHNLSEILNNTHKSEHQISEGQILLNTLASILNQSPENRGSVSMEDSGHSSFVNDAENEMIAPNADKHECYEVLDLRTSRSRSESDLTNNSSKGLQDLGVPLDLSAKSKTEKSGSRRLSRSYNFSATKSFPVKFNSSVQSQSSLELSKNNSKVSANGSVSSNDSRGISSTSRSSISKLKVKTSSESIAIHKKGPLRAIIPIESMAKQKSQDQINTKILNNTDEIASAPPVTTPKKAGETTVSNFQNEKTSTPIHPKSKMKPMAQSTPDAQSKSRLSYKPRYSGITKPSSGLCLPTPTGLRIRNYKFFPDKDRFDSVSSNSHGQLFRSFTHQHDTAICIRNWTNVSVGSTGKRYSTGSLTKEKPITSNISTQLRNPKLCTTGGSKKTSASVQRRYSLNEPKKPADLIVNMKHKRSNSIGKDSGVMSALSRVRENITKSPYYKSKLSHNAIPDGIEPLSSSLNENLRQSKIASLKLIRKFGKENKES